MARRVPSRVRAMHAAYCQPGGTMQGAADRFGISKKAVWAAFARYGLTVRFDRGRAPVSRSDILSVRAKNKAWCGQCEARVGAADVQRCASPFCKARAFLSPSASTTRSPQPSVQLS